MKNLYTIVVVLVTLIFASCIKEYDGSVNADESGFTGSKSEIENYFSVEVVNSLEELGYKFNVGGTPPDIAGSFFGNSQKLKNSNVPNDQIGMAFLDYIYTFYNQTDENIDYTQTYSGGTANGNGCFISGNGNNFSIYVVTEGTSGGYERKTAVAISGTLSSSGLTDFMLASIMLENYGNPGGNLLNNGQGRLIYEQDGTLEKQ